MPVIEEMDYSLHFITRLKAANQLDVVTPTPMGIPVISHILSYLFSGGGGRIK